MNKLKLFIYGLVFALIVISLLVPYVFTTSNPSPSPSFEKTDIGELSKISFSQFKNGKKVFELTAKKMKDMGQTVLLKDVSGDGIAGNGRSFSFKANRVELEKKDHSFKAFGDIELIFGDKKILGEKMIYIAKKNEYTVFHGIIYVNSKISISGRDIMFFPGLSKLIIGGEKNE